jgi:hypothetical protein
VSPRTRADRATAGCGGALNLAARLCSLAGPGEIFAGEEVVRLARVAEGLAYGDRGKVPLKGLAELVRVIQVLHAGAEPAQRRPRVAVVARPGTLPAQPMPFTGRVPEPAGGRGKTRLALHVQDAYTLPAHRSSRRLAVSWGCRHAQRMLAATVVVFYRSTGRSIRHNGTLPPAQGSSVQAFKPRHGLLPLSVREVPGHRIEQAHGHDTYTTYRRSVSTLAFNSSWG